jgi:hypothetical protein
LSSRHVDFACVRELVDLKATLYKKFCSWFVGDEKLQKAEVKEGKKQEKVKSQRAIHRSAHCSAGRATRRRILVEEQENTDTPTQFCRAKLDLSGD